MRVGGTNQIGDSSNPTTDAENKKTCEDRSKQVFLLKDTGIIFRPILDFKHFPVLQILFCNRGLA